MDKRLESLLKPYSLTSNEDRMNALKEIVQHLALVGLWRAKFFEHAAFYGGTALRIFHGLQRFSEDMDFSLIQKKQSFQLSRYFTDVEKELKSFGFHFEIQPKNKTKVSAVESAFIKGNTIENLMVIQVPSQLLLNFPKNQTIKIKFELDTDPPGTANFEMNTLLTPFPFQVKLYSLPDLFAGKLHAVLCRAWKKRVKGRDYYDMIWFLGKKILCHLNHLKERMVQTGHWTSNEDLTRNHLIELLKKRFSEVDFDAAAKDVSPFIKDRQELDLWNRDFFSQIVKEIEAV